MGCAPADFKVGSPFVEDRFPGLGIVIGDGTKNLAGMPSPLPEISEGRQFYIPVPSVRLILLTPMHMPDGRQGTADVPVHRLYRWMIHSHALFKPYRTVGSPLISH